jgi:hypothetical protein
MGFWAGRGKNLDYRRRKIGSGGVKLQIPPLTDFSPLIIAVSC